MGYIPAFDSRAYNDVNQDVDIWLRSGMQQGTAGADTEYSRKYGINTSGWEPDWVKRANSKYGTNNTDMSQFTKDQLAQVHYENWGKNENRLGDAYQKRAAYYNTQDRSTKAVSESSRNALINTLTQRGYNPSTLQSVSNDELLSLGDQLGAQENQRRERQADRAEALTDFGSQLSSLTASKQRQAEQKGRIQQGVTRTQGLAQMMNNF